MLKDWDASFYSAGLVPAAIVYMSPPSPLPEGPVLRQAVAALQVRHPPPLKSDSEGSGSHLRQKPKHCMSFLPLCRPLIMPPLVLVFMQ